jgi:hypothetical protein
MLPLILAVAAFFAAAVIWIGNDHNAGERAFDEFSVENTSDSGLSLAFSYLQRSGRRVVRLDEQLRPALIPRNAVVIRAGEPFAPFFMEREEMTSKKKKKVFEKPRREVSPMLTPAEDDFVRGGGRIVLATTKSFGPIDIQGVKLTEKSATRVFPIWPGVDSIPLTPPRGIVISTMPPHMHVLFTADAIPVVACETIGAGDVIVMSIPETLQNEHLRSGKALSLLLALADSKRAVYFDESIHGFASTDSPFDLMKEWGLGPFLMMIGIAGLLIFWRNSTRVGPAEDDYRETRSDAVDLVRSLGALYKSATTDDEAISMYREALVRTVAAQTGLRGDALYRRVNQLTRPLTPSPSPRSAGRGEPSGAGVPSPRSRGEGGRRPGEGSFDAQLDAINIAFRTLAGGHQHAKHR